MRRVVIVAHTADGEVIPSDYRDGLIGEAETIEDARALVVKQGYELAPWDTPETVPGELLVVQDVDEDTVDAWAVGVIQ